MPNGLNVVDSATDVLDMHRQELTIQGGKVGEGRINSVTLTF